MSGDANSRMSKRGFNEEGDYWVKTKNNSDSVIGDGQEVALLIGKADVITGQNVETQDIIDGLTDGSMVASRSFVSYDGQVTIASFETPTIDALVASGDALNITRIDATTYEQLGGTLTFDANRTYDNFADIYESSLSNQNGNAYGDILADQQQTGGF